MIWYGVWEGVRLIVIYRAIFAKYNSFSFGKVHNKLFRQVCRLEASTEGKQNKSCKMS